MEENNNRPRGSRGDYSRSNSRYSQGASGEPHRRQPAQRRTVDLPSQQRARQQRPEQPRQDAQPRQSGNQRSQRPAYSRTDAPQRQAAGRSRQAQRPAQREAAPTEAQQRRRSDYSRSNSRYAAGSQQGAPRRSAANGDLRRREAPASSGFSRGSSNSRYSNAGASRGKRKKIIMAVVGVLLIALIGCGTAFGIWYHKVMGNISSDENVELYDEVAGEPYYVLLIGGDDRGEYATSDDAGNRTDSLMVVRVDEQNQMVNVLSIPRDTRVYIEGHGYNKVNTVYEFLGLQGLLDTVGNLLDINISYYAFIYFDGFETLVDKLDGVTVEVPEGTYYAGVSVPAGDAVEINGEEALVLARCRTGNPPNQGAYAAGDYQRTINQRNLIKAIAKKVLSRDISEYPALIEGLSECVETNMSVRKLISLARTMRGMDVDGMDCGVIPVAGVLADGMSCCAIYEDVFQQIKTNLHNGETLFAHMYNYNWLCNNHDMTGRCDENGIYTYTYYSYEYGDPFGEPPEPEPEPEQSEGEGNGSSS